MNSSLAFLSCFQVIPIRYIKKAYLLSVGLGTSYGFIQGTCNWFTWLSKREQVKLKANRHVNVDMINPILNVGRDVGYLGWHSITSAAVSGFIIGTYPISIPALLLFSEKEDDKKDDH